MTKEIQLSFLIAWLMISSGHIAYAQQENKSTSTKFIDFNLGIGDSEGNVAVSFKYNKNLGPKKKIVVGLMASATGYLGKNQYYITAPAKLTSGSTGPGVLFKENIKENIDTFLVKSAQINALNLAIVLGYNLSNKLMLRFTIDAIGFSFGKSERGNYINGSQGAVAPAKPTPVNLLLISDNDRGTLNSELFARYMLNDRWGIKGGVQFLFTEYTTRSEIQQFPEPNDRFRNKSLMIAIGISHKL